MKTASGGGLAMCTLTVQRDSFDALRTYYGMYTSRFSSSLEMCSRKRHISERKVRIYGVLAKRAENVVMVGALDWRCPFGRVCVFPGIVFDKV